MTGRLRTAALQPYATSLARKMSGLFKKLFSGASNAAFVRPGAVGLNGGLRAAPNGRIPRRADDDATRRPAAIGQHGGIKGSKASRRA